MRHRRYRDGTGTSRTLGTVMTKPASGATHKGRAWPVPTAHEDPSASLESGLLAELRAALADQGIRSELRQEIPCLAVEAAAYRLWIFVSTGGRYFSWNNAEFQHPVFDIPDAARRIAMQVHQEGKEGPA